MRRLVNTLIQLIDYYPGNVLLLCATSHPGMIDPALLGHFQLHVDFEMPASGILDRYYDRLLSRFPKELQDIERKYG